MRSQKVIGERNPTDFNMSEYLQYFNWSRAFCTRMGDIISVDDWARWGVAEIIFPSSFSANVFAEHDIVDIMLFAELCDVLAS